MTDDRLDLSPLSPDDRLVRRVTDACAPQLAERRSRAMSIQIAMWWRPALAAALLIALASGLILARPPAAPPNPGPPALARAVGVPTPLARRLTSERPPDVVELMEIAQ